MRKFILLLIFFPLAAFPQKDSLPKNGDGLYEYTEVVNVDSISADKLYSNARLFVVKAFKSGKEVIQLNDDVSKTFAGSGTIPIVFRGLGGMGGSDFVKFKFFIQAKDSRYKYSITNFEVSAPPRSAIALESEKMKRAYTKNMNKQIIEQVSFSMEKFIEDMKKNMASQTRETKDW